MAKEFQHHHNDRVKLGELYRFTLAKYGDQVTVTFLDPRNFIGFFIYFSHHVRKGHICFSTACKHMLVHTKLNAVFINGQYLDRLEDYDTIIQNFIES